jgi:hypothetical protein
VALRNNYREKDMKTIKRYWLALIPFLIATVFGLIIPLACPMPTGAQSGITDFQSVEELKDFLAQDKAPLILRANESGVVSFNGVCNEYAIQLRDRALEKGKYLSVQVVSRLEYYKATHRILDDGQYHTMNMAIIGRTYYLIEPKTDEIWLAYRMP